MPTDTWRDFAADPQIWHSYVMVGAESFKLSDWEKTKRRPSGQKCKPNGLRNYRVADAWGCSEKYVFSLSVFHFLLLFLRFLSFSFASSCFSISCFPFSPSLFFLFSFVFLSFRKFLFLPVFLFFYFVSASLCLSSVHSLLFISFQFLDFLYFRGCLIPLCVSDSIL